MFRGIAAAAVFVGHLRALFFVGFTEIQQPAALTKCLYFMTGYGHQAVIIFFVLSGYFISNSILDARRKGIWRWESYSVSRLTRLYVVLIPALLLTSAWDQFGMRLFGSANIYGGANQAVVVGGILNRSGVNTCLGNALFLQGIACVPFGSNGPLWSLSYEFWYYVLFPLILAVVWRGQLLQNRVIAGLLGAAVFVVMTPEMRRYFSVWLMGSAIVLLPRPHCLILAVSRVVAPTALVAVLLLARANQRLAVLDFVVGACFAWTCYVLIYSRLPEPSQWYRVIAGALSSGSYTLYLVHVPLLVFISAWFLPGAVCWQPDLRHLIYAICIAAIVAMYTFFIWSITEAHHIRVRQAVMAAIRRKRSISA